MRDIDNVHHSTLATACAPLFARDVGQDGCKAHTPCDHISRAAVAIQDVILFAQGSDGGGLTDLLAGACVQSAGDLSGHRHLDDARLETPREQGGLENIQHQFLVHHAPPHSIKSSGSAPRPPQTPRL